MLEEFEKSESEGVFDIGFIDISMPGMNGFEVVSALRLMISGYNQTH